MCCETATIMNVRQMQRRITLYFAVNLFCYWTKDLIERVFDRANRRFQALPFAAAFFVCITKNATTFSMKMRCKDATGSSSALDLGICVFGLSTTAALAANLVVTFRNLSSVPGRIVGK